MIFKKMFDQTDLLETAMKASEYKNQTILNNIANNDTPKYKAKRVDFEGVLREAVEDAEFRGEEPDFEGITAKLKYQHRDFSTRIDDNNVDIETEMVNFYKNSTKYDVMTNSVLNNSSRLNTVLTGLR